MASATVDQVQVEAFAERALGDFGGMMTTLSCIIGDRLGLFERLASISPATADELAAAAGVDGRYALEWLRHLAAAGYVEHDRGDDRYALPPAHAAVLADAAHPMYMGGAFQMTAGALPVLDAVTQAFRDGAGVLQNAYSPDFWTGMSRFSQSWIDHQLLQSWLPAVPGVRERLERGAHVADVGCGAGGAVLRLAEAFPRSTFVGFDAFEGQLELARAGAQAADVDDRVRFEQRDVAQGLTGTFDVIATFDVVHDAAEPRAVLRAIRRGLRDDGAFLLVDINCADDHADNVGPLAKLFYGFSLMYCMTTSLAHGGAGLGTCGLPEATARELCLEAGFSDLRRAPLDDPFNAVYDVRP